MGVFDAASIVEPLDFKFEAFVPGCNGTIKEPTDKQIAQFWADLRKLIADTRRHAEETGKALADASGDEDATEAIAGLDDVGAAVELHRRMAEIHSALCSGSPSEAELLRLPMRIRTPFYGWLQQEVMNPEAVAGGGNAQVRTLRSAAAG
jgi:hypothetical protein